VGPGSMSFEVAGKWQIQRKNVDLRARFPQVFYKLSTALILRPYPRRLKLPRAATRGRRGLGGRRPESAASAARRLPRLAGWPPSGVAELCLREGRWLPSVSSFKALRELAGTAMLIAR
jgi:hypothetical protein